MVEVNLAYVRPPRPRPVELRPYSFRGSRLRSAAWTGVIGQRKLQEAEAELDAARTRTQVNEAAKRLQRAKAELKRLEIGQAEKPQRRS